MSALRVTIYTDGTIIVHPAHLGPSLEKPIARAHVTQAEGGTIVTRPVRGPEGHLHSVQVVMPRNRYALAVERGLSLTGNPGRDQFDRDLITALGLAGVQS